jgi:hypothetical protein
MKKKSEPTSVEKRVKKWASRIRTIERRYRTSSFDSYEHKLRQATMYLLKAISDYETRFSEAAGVFSSEIRIMIRSADILRTGLKHRFIFQQRNSREGTMKRQQSIWRHVYYVVRYVLPVYSATGQHVKIKRTVRGIFDHELSEYVRYPDRIDNLSVILPILDYLRPAGIAESRYLQTEAILTKSDEKRCIQTRTRELREDLRKGECQDLEFKASLPSNMRARIDERAA